MLSLVFNWIANTLNNWENHRTRTAYEDNLIFKTFAFQLFNYYGALAYTAFFKHMSEQGCQDGDCMMETRQLLLIIFVTRMGKNVVEIGLPMWSNRQRMNVVETGLPMWPFEMESKLAVSDDTLSDYAEMVLQVLSRLLDLISSRALTQLLTNRYVPTHPHSPNCCSTASSSCS